MTYEGVEITDSLGRPLGLRVKNGQIVNEPQFDYAARKAWIEGLQVKQPWTIAKEKARAEALAKKRK
jgi:hypothetical protein